MHRDDTKTEPTRLLGLSTELHDRLFAFLINLDRLDRKDQPDAIANEVIETGGIYCCDHGDRFEVTLHGITAYARSQHQAPYIWIIAATFATNSDIGVLECIS
ncbi:hypothetical protein [Pseudogemmobacter sp. W21_MBD1_M6]|uniref:hypothetical protein n=1 Tax=Pseudogemmobacter sp. W21_MBD1_M6 TaxID=3240271 RepID=UPI003F9BB6EC